MIRQSNGGSSDGSSGGSDDSGGGLVSDLGTEIKVTLDRWSVGQLGLTDLIAAGVVIVAGFVVAWLIRRLIARGTRHMSGTALTATGTIGKLVGATVHLLAAALALEILGFRLGPILMLMLIAVLAVLLLRPMITNLSDGLLLQLRGALDQGDLVQTGGVLGVVREITTRTTVIETSDGRRVHVPNTDVLNDVIVNYTSFGRLRSSFEIMVSADEDLKLVVATMRLALAEVGAIHNDPQPNVFVTRIVGRLAAVRTQVWHPPSLAARRTACDEGLRAVVTDLRAAGIALDGPTPSELYSDLPSSNDDDDA